MAYSTINTSESCGSSDFNASSSCERGLEFGTDAIDFSKENLQGITKEVSKGSKRDADREQAGEVKCKRRISHFSTEPFALRRS